MSSCCYKYSAIADTPDCDATQVQAAGYELNMQNEEQQELVEDEDITIDNMGM